MQLSPTCLKGTLSPRHATTIHETTQDRACQETQSKTGFCFETAVDLHLSAPPLPSPVYHNKPRSRGVRKAVGPAQPSTPTSQGCAHSTRHETSSRSMRLAASSRLPRCTTKCKNASKFSPSLAHHTHRGCRMGSQTMRITPVTFETKKKDFKSQSGAKHTPSSHSRGAFPNTGHAGTGSAQPGRFFFFSYQEAADCAPVQE